MYTGKKEVRWLILILDTADFRIQYIIEYKNGYYIMYKRLDFQKTEFLVDYKEMNNHNWRCQHSPFHNWLKEQSKTQ